MVIEQKCPSKLFNTHYFASKFCQFSKRGPLLAGGSSHLGPHDPAKPRSKIMATLPNDVIHVGHSTYLTTVTMAPVTIAYAMVTN